MTTSWSVLSILRPSKPLLRVVLVMAAFFMAATLVPPHAATAHVANSVDEPQPGALIHNRCREVFAFPQVPYEHADALVPEGYTVRRFGDEKTGPARLLITTRYCEKLTVGGRTVRDAIDSYITVGLDERFPPAIGAKPHESFIVPWEERSEIPGDEGVLRLESYLVQWVTNNELHAEWLKESTGLGDQVHLVRGLRYAYNPALIPGDTFNFFFEVPAPAPSRFHVEAKVTAPGPAAWDVGLNLWADTHRGILNIFGEHYKGADQLFGPAEGTITSDNPSSPLGRMFGSEQERPIWPPENPELQQFTSGFYTDVQWLKCVRTPANDCTRDDH